MAACAEAAVQKTAALRTLRKGSHSKTHLDLLYRFVKKTSSRFADFSPKR